MSNHQGFLTEFGRLPPRLALEKQIIVRWRDAGFEVFYPFSTSYLIAREGGAPAKDPPNSQTYIQTYIQAYTSIHKLTYKHTYKQYLQAYIQNKAEAIHTSILTSIPKSIHINQSRRPPKQHPKKQNSKKYITLYNSKYCIR